MRYEIKIVEGRLPITDPGLGFYNCIRNAQFDEEVRNFILYMLYNKDGNSLLEISDIKKINSLDTKVKKS